MVGQHCCLQQNSDGRAGCAHIIPLVLSQNMPAPDRLLELRTLFEAHGQEHVFKHVEHMTADEKAGFCEQLACVPVEKLHGMLADALNTLDSPRPSLTPISMSKVVETAGGRETESANYRLLGLEAIARGKVAVVTLAGGQGTRLGSSAPKGCYDIGLPSHKSLFQIQAERLLKVSSLASACKKQMPIRWYIMTSRATHVDTTAFFEKHDYFGMPSDRIEFFQQGSLPALTNDGKIMMTGKSALALSPDGNGGIYSALERNGILDRLEKEGIKYVHMYCVDNVLVRPADPVFIGAAISAGSDCASKAVGKRSPSEPVGVFVEEDGRMAVAEYSELAKEAAEAVGAGGKLVYNYANIANHLFTVDFLNKVAKHALPWHVARKKIPSIDMATGKAVAPMPMGIKLEAFIFDVLLFSESPLVVNVDRTAEFAPLKNGADAETDNPQSSRQAVFALHRAWLEAAGAKIECGEDALATVEVSPRLSYGGEGLEKFDGARLASPLLLQ